MSPCRTLISRRGHKARPIWHVFWAPVVSVPGANPQGLKNLPCWSSFQCPLEDLFCSLTAGVKSPWAGPVETPCNFTRFLSFEISYTFWQPGPSVWVMSVTSPPDLDLYKHIFSWAQLDTTWVTFPGKIWGSCSQTLACLKITWQTYSSVDGRATPIFSFRGLCRVQELCISNKLPCDTGAADPVMLMSPLQTLIGQKEAIF